MEAKTGIIAADIAQRAAAVVDTRVDIINILVEELVRQGHELPAFGTLDEFAEQAHAAVESALYMRIGERLSEEQKKWLDKLLEAELPQRRTLYHQIKRSAKKASRKHLDLVLDQLTWLEALPDSDVLLADVPANKLKHLAHRTATLDAGEMKDFQPAACHTLVLALIRQMRIAARDDIAVMFIRRMGAVHKSAKEELFEIQARQRELSEELVATLEQVVDILAEGLDATTGKRVHDLLAPEGNLEKLQSDCAAIRVWSGGNHLPLLWKPFRSWRAAMFQMARVLRFTAATQDTRLLKALEVVLENEHRKSEWIGDVDLSFVSERWRKLVRYIDLIASAVILQNTVDMMRIMQDLYAVGEPVSAADAAFMSPYGTTGVKRFGNYHLDLKRPQEPWLKESLFRQAVQRAREEATREHRADDRTGGAT